MKDIIICQKHNSIISMDDDYVIYGNFKSKADVNKIIQILKREE